MVVIAATRLRGPNWPSFRCGERRGRNIGRIFGACCKFGVVPVLIYFLLWLEALGWSSARSVHMPGSRKSGGGR